MSEVIGRLPISNPEGIKSPVNVATTGNIPLRGLQTINGYALDVKDRVLVKDQNDPSQNGIYIALEHDWLRAQDWKIGSQVANGVIILDSHTNNVWRVAYNDTLFVGTTPVSFTPVVVAGNFSALLNFDYLEGGLNVNEYDFPVDTVAHVKTYSETLSGGITALWKKLDVTGPVSQLPKERLDLRCVDGTGAVWELLHTGEVFISTIGGDQNADNANVIRAFDNKAPYLNLEGKEWPCPGLSTDSGAQREILNSKVINGTLLITNSLSGETRAQTFAPYLESEAQLSETKSPIIDWTGLNVLWLGTSIPHQGAGVDSYPERVADKLNFKVQNYAWSGSHIFYDINGDAFDNGTIRALSMTEADRLAGLAQYGSSSTYDDSFNIVTKASEMTAEYRIKAQFENGPIDVVVLDHNHNDRKNVIEYPKNVKNITGATLGTSTTFNVDNTEGLTIGDGCYVVVTGATRLNYAAGRITGIGSNTVTIGYDSSSLSGTVTGGELHWVDRNTIKGAWDFIIAYIKNMDARYGQTDVKIILSGAPSYFTNDVDRDHSIWSINRIISEIADSWGLYYFDVANALRLTYRDHMNYLPDAVHPNTPETREVFANLWATWMRNGVGNFYNPQSVLQRNKTIDNQHNQPALYSFYDGAYARRDVIYIEDTPLIDDDFATDFDDWLALGTGSPVHVDAPWGSGKAVQFDVNINNTSPYLRQDVPVGTVPVLEFDFLIDDDTIATGITQQLTIASISGPGGSGYNVTITQSVGGDLSVRATYNKGGFGESPIVSFPNSSKIIQQDVKYRVKLDVIEGYARFTIDGEVIFKGAIDNEALQDAEVILVGPTFSNMGSAFSVFIGNVVAGAKITQHVMTTEELQNTVQSYTLEELTSMEPTLTGRRVICSDMADAPLELAPSGYVALPGDITAANGRVWALVVDGVANILNFGAKAENSTFDNQLIIQGALDRLNGAGGGELIIPKVSNDYYGIQGPLIVYSNIAVKQYGDILNYGTADLFWRPSVWWFGVLEGFDQTGSAFDFPSEPLTQSEILPEDTSVDVANGGDWSVGDVVLVESVERLDASIYPKYSWLNTIERIVGNKLHLKYASGDYMGTGGNPVIRKIPTEPLISSPSSVRIVYDGPCFLCVNSSLELFDGAKFGSTNPLNEDRWSVSLWLSCYECEFKGKGVIQATSQVIAGNPFSHSAMEDISGFSQTSGCELAYLTHNSYFENAKMAVVEGNKGLAAVTNGFTFSWLVGSEGGHTNYFKNCEGHFGRDGNVATTTGQSSVALIGKNSTWQGGVINGKNKPSAASGLDATFENVKVSGGKDFGISGQGNCHVNNCKILDKNRNFASIGANNFTEESVVESNYLGDGSHFSHQIYFPDYAVKNIHSSSNHGRSKSKDNLNASIRTVNDTSVIETIDCNLLSATPMDKYYAEIHAQVVNNTADKIFNVDFRYSKATITNITQASNGVVTLDDASGYVSGELIWIDNVAGMTELNGKYHIVNNVSGNDLTITTDTSGYASYLSGGTAERVRRSKDAIIPNGTPASGGENVIFTVDGSFLSVPSKRIKVSLESETIQFSTWFNPAVANDAESTLNITCRTQGGSYQVLFSKVTYESKSIDNRTS